MIDLPQRVSATAAIGTLLKSALRTAKTTGSSRRASPPDAAHLAAVRALPCLKCGMEPAGEAHHVRARRQMMGKRPSDDATVPLCASCHRHDADSLHKVGEANFWADVGIDPRLVAERLAAASGDAARMRMVALVAIAARSS